MFTVRQVGENRLEIHIAGEIDRASMDAGLEVMIRAAEDIERGTVLYTVNDFEVPELPAIVAEIAKIPALFRAIRHFERIAVVADEQWLRKVSEVKGALLPGLEIKAFEPEQIVEAEAWLDSLDEAV